MKTTLIILAFTFSIHSLMAQIPFRLPFISIDGNREQLVQMPIQNQNIIKAKWALKTAQQVINQYYTITDVDVNVFGTDVLEIDSFIYLNGNYRQRLPDSIQISSWQPFTMKLNQQGEKIWVRTDSLGEFNHWRGYMGSIAKLADGKILTMGRYESYDTVQTFFNEKPFLSSSIQQAT